VSEAKLQSPGAKLRRGNEIGRRQGYGQPITGPAEASAKAGGLFEK
jgi:hypothetical protein